MPIITIAHKPDLTVEQVVEIFRKRFEPKYRVEVLKGFFGRGVLIRGRDFIVVKNPWVGVGVKLQQSDSKTKFVYSGRVPRWWAWWIGGFWLGVFLWVGLRKEVAEMIRTAPEFRDAWPAAADSRLPSAQAGLPAMFCASCGAPLAGQARFCRACGAPVSGGEPA